jgi:hypothetical protein
MGTKGLVVVVLQLHIAPTSVGMLSYQEVTTATQAAMQLG